MDEVQLLMWMNCCLFLRYDVNQERAVPVMLREDSRLERRMLSWPESAVRKGSIVTLRKAVSGLCWRWRMD